MTEYAIMCKKEYRENYILFDLDEDVPCDDDANVYSTLAEAEEHYARLDDCFKSIFNVVKIETI